MLFTFQQNAADLGIAPFAGVIQGHAGNFYGTTYQGGTNGTGTVYEVTSSGTETVLYSFGPQPGTDGSSPRATLIQLSDGDFYGLTGLGGAHGTGIVFKLTPSGTETVLHAFGPSPGTDGSDPYGALIQGSDGNLYGTTEEGGANGLGTVFKITP